MEKPRDRGFFNERLASVRTHHGLILDRHRV
jgi:hypothetical protein